MDKRRLKGENRREKTKENRWGESSSIRGDYEVKEIKIERTKEDIEGEKKKIYFYANGKKRR